MTVTTPHRAKGASTKGVMALFAGRRMAMSFNARVAIRRAVGVLGLTPGDEVLAPAWNCGSELDPLLAAGLSVRLYAADGQGTVDPDALARQIGAHTRAVYLIHYFGFLQPHAAAIRALCDASGLRLIEDCALSLLSGGAAVAGGGAGGGAGLAGDVSVFCFYKFFPVLGGGALIVNAHDLPDPAAFARPVPWRPVVRHLLRAGAGRVLGPRGLAAVQCLRRSALAEAAAPTAEGLPDMPEHYYFNPQIREAGISPFTRRALAGVDVAAEIVARRAGYQRFLERLEGRPGVAPLFPRLTEGSVPLGMPVRVAAGLRDAIARTLQAEGIAATPWWAGYHRGLDFAGQPEACGLKDGTVFLPLSARPEGRGNSAWIDRAADRLAALARPSSP